MSINIGLSTLEPEYRDILRSLGASRTTIFWKIALPKDSPLMFAVQITLAVLGIVHYYVVVALERIFVGWAERPSG